MLRRVLALHLIYVYPPKRENIAEGMKRRKLTPSGNLLPRSRHADDDALSPPLMTRLKRTPHNMHIARTIKRIVTPAIRHLDEFLLDALAANLGRVDEVRGTELHGPVFFAVVDVHDDDLASLVLDCALDDGETDAARAEDGDVGALFDTSASGSDDGRAVAGCDAAAEQACAVHGCLLSEGHDGYVGYNGVLREGGCAHKVKEILALALEARGAVRHDAFALRGADLAAEVGLAGLAEFAFFAFGGAGRVRYKSRGW
jgi:hypothetical protein